MKQIISQMCKTHRTIEILESTKVDHWLGFGFHYLCLQKLKLRDLGDMHDYHYNNIWHNTLNGWMEG